MKKLISIILAVMLVSALAVTSFAAQTLPSINYVFRATDDVVGGDNQEYLYIFGNTNNASKLVAGSNNELKDVGINIVDYRGVTHYVDFGTENSEELAKVVPNGNFGFKIKDNGMLEEEFYAKPRIEYSINNSTKSPVVPLGGYVHKINLAEKSVKAEQGDTRLARTKYSTINTYSKSATVTDPAMDYLRRLLITFDITSFDKTADKYYLHLPTYTDTTQATALMTAGFNASVYATTDNSNYTHAAATYNDTFENGTVVLGDKIADFTAKDCFWGNLDQELKTNYYNGIRVDITKYVEECIENGINTFTLCIVCENQNSMVYFGTNDTASNYACIRLVATKF